MIVLSFASAFNAATAADYEVKPLTDEFASEYKLDQAFYTKATMAEGVLIATSSRVCDDAHREAAYQFG
ncbi:MAG: hypothetical protein O3A00_24470, partial [Planctomycetota bacterium]|nr:hypothetical protein [Planctomycetota bacterium]